MDIQFEKIVSLLWKILFVLFIVSCILSKIFELHYLHKTLPLAIPYVILSFIISDMAIDNKPNIIQFMITWIFASVGCFVLEWIRLFIVEGLPAFQIILSVIIDSYDNIPPELYDITSYNLVLIIAAALIGLVAYLPFLKIKQRQNTQL